MAEASGAATPDAPTSVACQIDETGLRRLLAGLTAVRDGDFRTRIPEDGGGLLGDIATVFNGMLDQLSRFTSEVTRVAREVGSEGRLGGQARVPDVSGSWKDLTESVNAMAGNLTTQVRNIAQVATAVACGDLSQKITVDARGEILELKETINTMVDQLSAFADEVTRVAREVGTEGNLGGQATVRGVSGTWKDLTDNVNVMASNLTGQVRNIAQVATAVARGDLSQRIVVEAKGEVAALAGVINTMVDTLSAFADEVTRVASEVGTDGILGGQARVPHLAGTWKDLTDSVNSMANNLTGQVRNIAQVTTAVAGGDLTRKIDVDARGEILELKTTINTMVDQLSSFAAEVTRVAREVGSEGRLGGQAEVEGVSGTWKRLTENVNELAGNLTRQVRAIAEVTSAVAEGDLTRSITVDASGEVAELKDNINAMVKSLRQTTQANQEQDWLKTNLARISGLMQGRRDLTDVARLIMDELVPLVSAQYGAFFLAEDTHEGVQLCLIDSYGRPEGSHRPTRFRLGESLVGQAARSRRTIAVDDVPADYVTVSSGLGGAAPASLVVLPVTAEEQVLGVIELASTGRFTPVHRDFLDQLMETIGVNVNTIIANARTDELLGESQRLAGELQARSEELQVRQEELQHSNAELEEKAALLASQKRDIETKNLEIEQARQELEDRARELGRASKYKSEFLANMSHELRTPLNSLLILAQLLAQNPSRNLTPKQVEYAEVIHSAGSDLLQLINDILDLSKVEAGKMDISPERFRLRRLLDDLEAAFRPLTSQKGLEFRVVTAPGVPAEVVTDESRLRQVLRNLLSNAVKFTEAGYVELRIEPVDTAAANLPDSVRRGGPALAFRVSDTGIGISDQHLGSIFGAFQQADGTTSRKYGGTGLGLSICREIAYLLGGSIHARSTRGEGSCFTLYLPTVHPAVQDTAAPPAAAAAPAAAVSGAELRDRRGTAPGGLERPGEAGLAADTHGAPPAGRRVLVVEARRGLLSLLTESAVADLPGVPSHVRVDTAADPGEAAAALADRTHHCAVVDCGLSGEGAGELLHLLDTDPALGHVPVLVHCSHPAPSAEEEHRLRARAGAQPLEVLTSLDELRERIGLHLSAEHPGEALPLVRTPETRPEAAPQEADPLADRTVLIVDDDARNVFALTGILELHGMRVLHAENGREGVEALADEDIDLVLMDVMMPEMDGYSATAAIRAMPKRRRVPIIAVTAKAMSGDREKCLAAGADDYVPKPVDAQQLVHCMRRWLDL
ncbi:HAMP domain-containing protein [Streptomyces sp. TRM72054]|uniref:HAMP domain-containing protein n=1 Tax=Streptomyces sp. TRM72054 TaxID=2870562 RepID=UPI001C8C80B9|nr:HAMP domain-containing protein [Streptomyces sp. TRM72054]MBX9399281.1 HAMP domain-containing protein [Streptomyces sp. TRM72054]